MAIDNVHDNTYINSPLTGAIATDTESATWDLTLAPSHSAKFVILPTGNFNAGDSIDAKLQETNDNVNWNDVDLEHVIRDMNRLKANAIHDYGQLGYAGDKRYIRLKFTAVNGTPEGVVFVQKNNIRTMEGFDELYSN